MNYEIFYLCYFRLSTKETMFTNGGEANDETRREENIS